MDSKKITPQQAFTFVEILVVVTIIGIITTIGLTSYAGFLKQSRDAKRKGDLENIRGALELFRSKNNRYPLSSGEFSWTSALCDPSPGNCSTGQYMGIPPNDPRTEYTYYYISVAPGSTYTLGAYLENPPTSGSTCGNCIKIGTQACNYCLGPFGQL